MSQVGCDQMQGWYQQSLHAFMCQVVMAQCRYTCQTAKEHDAVQGVSMSAFSTGCMSGMPLDCCRLTCPGPDDPTNKQDSAGIYISKIFWLKHPGCLSVSKQPAHKTINKLGVLNCAKLIKTVYHTSIRQGRWRSSMQASLLFMLHI